MLSLPLSFWRSFFNSSIRNAFCSISLVYCSTCSVSSLICASRSCTPYKKKKNWRHSSLLAISLFYTQKKKKKTRKREALLKKFPFTDTETTCTEQHISSKVHDKSKATMTKIIKLHGKQIYYTYSIEFRY